MKGQSATTKNKLRVSVFWNTRLEGADGGRLEPQVGLEVLGDLPHETLERQLADQQLGRLLVPPDLTEGDRTGAIPELKAMNAKLTFT